MLMQHYVTKFNKFITILATNLDRRTRADLWEADILYGHLLSTVMKQKTRGLWQGPYTLRTITSNKNWLRWNKYNIPEWCVGGGDFASTWSIPGFDRVVSRCPNIKSNFQNILLGNQWNWAEGLNSQRRELESTRNAVIPSVGLPCHSENSSTLVMMQAANLITAYFTNWFSHLLAPKCPTHPRVQHEDPYGPTPMPSKGRRPWWHPCWESSSWYPCNARSLGVESVQQMKIVKKNIESPSQSAKLPFTLKNQ